MKSNRIFGALMIISLSFTACKKDASEIAQPQKLEQPHEAPLAERHLAPFVVSAELPKTITDLFTKVIKHFVYNEKKQLAFIKESSGKKTSFFYDNLNRLERFTVVNESADAAFSSAFAYKYDGKNLLPSSVDEFRLSAEGLPTFVKSITFHYDDQLNKISEIENTPNTNGNNTATSRKFYYNANGNCTRKQELKGGQLMREFIFTEFDSHPSFGAAVKTLQLIPGAIVQKNNPLKMYQSLGNEKFLEHKYSYRFDGMGFPIQINDDVSESVLVIEYLDTAI